MIDKKLLDILVCPVTKGPLHYDKEKQELVSKSARLAYPIREGIPIMLEDEARTLDDSETIIIFRNMGFDIVIPARYESSRLPGKPLLEVQGKPLIQWVYEAATKVMHETLLLPQMIKE